MTAETNRDDPNDPTAGRFVVDHYIAAPPAEVFALLADPTRHHQTEPGDWVRDAIDAEPLTHVGQVFGINMGFPQNGEPYTMHNRVIAFEQDRALAWEPGQYDQEGVLGTGGWTWRYDLEPTAEGTRVQLTYDWSAVPLQLSEQFGLPPFRPDFLERSLRSLEEAVVAPTAGR
ncbi:SRPBCC family protein [Dietzia aurantiaca]|uniref:SRPBCC family protein n=1 Tax=Dietzia aurantiaca TaxID=983873 RepID=A0ABV9PMI5_9ACTN